MANSSAPPDMVSALRGRHRPQALIAALDAQPARAAAAALLLVVATAYAYVFLGRYPALTMLRQIITGPEAARFTSQAWPRLPVWNLIGNCVFAGIVGVVAAATVRRLKWLVGPFMILLVMCAATITALVHFGAATPMYPGSATLIHYQFDPSATGFLSIGAILICAAIAGALSPRIARRVPISLFATGAAMWVVVLVLDGLCNWAWMAMYNGVPYSDSSLPKLALRAAAILPYGTAAAFMVWMLRRLSLWIAALTVGVMPGFLLLSGMVRMWSAGGQWASVLNGISLVLNALASAAVGAWLAEAVLALRPRRDVVLHGLAVVAVIIVAAEAGWLLSWQSESAKPTSLSSAIEPPINDGEIVLLEKGNAIGVIIPTKQTTEPERASYDWYYRTDGGGTFRPQDAGRYRSGHVEGAKQVRFGPFSVPWSGHSDGSGYLYYDRFPGSQVTSGGVRICPTHELNLATVNAYDPHWVFKGSPSDPGIRLSKH